MHMTGRIDVHIHSLLSDGSLLPTEILRRMACLGCAGLSFAEHADSSNIEAIVAALHQLVAHQGKDYDFPILVGVELTHIAPQSIGRLARQARMAGAQIVVVHGETLVEPVAPGTNRAAVACRDVDVLAHPGLITLEETQIAAANGVYLELSARGGNALANGRVAALAREAGAALVVNSDAHEPSDLIDLEMARRIALGAGLTPDEAEAAVCTHPAALLQRALARRP
jgi:histidinol phosphatase-like PHP family hydrolase